MNITVNRKKALEALAGLPGMSSTHKGVPQVKDDGTSDIITLFQQALKGRMFLSFKTAHAAVLRTDTCRSCVHEKWAQGDAKVLAEVAGTILPGADALLVSRKGTYGNGAPVENHRSWLKEHGYSVFPAQIVKIVK